VLIWLKGNLLQAQSCPKARKRRSPVRLRYGDQVAEKKGALAKLTTPEHVGMFANMDATLIRSVKRTLADGYIYEIVIWLVPEPVPGSTHDYKYRLFFGRHGKRIVGYDNERGKGDHRHIDGRELDYLFFDIDQLELDFMADIQKWRAKQ
jgi:hypothetical protein